ncbi:glycosyltransferase [Pontimonas sp.]|uniref:glycosyltransferase n=1 Tax=Pontimonas sp. TaxID=2304492 RepID=UPI0028702347|nr:glycosyltransferase [Pontimonas sp.]MDR9397390.1 glycosyltransferase [Pontimonas sp.]
MQVNSSHESHTPRIKVVFVAAHDSVGGAARAAYRVFDAIRTHCADEIDITFRVVHKTRDDDQIVGGKPIRSRLEYARYFLRTRFRKYFPRKPFVSNNTLLHSQARYPSGLGREINAMTPDVVMLGWLGNATLSIEEIGALQAPIVWRLSDMWMFSGAEHYTDTGRYQEGYSRRSRPDTESGPDIDRETFRRKKRHWKRPSHVVALTTWLEKEARSSVLTQHWPSHVIPVPIDTDFWSPQPKTLAREELGIPLEDTVIVFGAGGGTAHRHKGADLLFDTLADLQGHRDNTAASPSIRVVVFGESREEENRDGIPVQYVGRLNDAQLRSAYCAADVFVAPSRLEAFGQVAAEAQSCGTPVVAFDNSGLSDVVHDRVTGRLASAFDTQSLAEAIRWVVSNPKRQATLGEAARQRAIELWSPRVVAEAYVSVLKRAASKPA